jgi:hypothetical protein
MGGSPKQTTDTRATSETNPWTPTLPALGNIIGQLGNGLGNTAPTANENAAFGALTANALGGNPYAGAIGNVASSLLAGGGPDRSGIVSGAYDTLRGQLAPWASGAMADPSQNPALLQALDTTRADVTNQINGMFAGAGRDLSGMNVQALARGIAQGEAPTLLNAQQTALQAANQLYNAGSATAGTLSALDQARLANQQAGINASSAALQARDSAANQLLALEAQRRNLPLQNLGNIQNLLVPLAQLGNESSQSSTSTTTTQVPLWQQIVGGAIGGAGALAKMGAFGNGGWLYGGPSSIASGIGSLLSSVPSDARLKEDIAPVGRLFDDTPVYRYRYKGDPTPRIGLIAQDVEARNPSAVSEIGGVKAVDYGKATARAGILGHYYGDGSMAGLRNGGAFAPRGLLGAVYGAPYGEAKDETDEATDGAGAIGARNAAFAGRPGPAQSAFAALAAAPAAADAARAAPGPEASVPLPRPRPAIGGDIANAGSEGGEGIAPPAAGLAAALRAINDNSSMLMALGGGMMTGGLGRGLQAAATASESERKEKTQSAHRAVAYRALLAAGVPPAIAQAAALNPELLRTVGRRAFGQKAPGLE